MPHFTFSTSKHRNLVEVSMTYRNGNDRNDVENEIGFLNELNRLMAATAPIHNHGDDPTVRPNIDVIDRDTYLGYIDLKFPIKTQFESDEAGLKAYSFAGLHAVLVEISQICERHRGKFQEFGVRLNLEAMRAPWVLPVDGQGVILREGSRQIDYSGIRLPSKAKLGVDQFDVTQLIAVGEPLAVKLFDRAWRYLCEQYKYAIAKEPNHLHRDRGPVIDVEVMKDMWPDIRWGNVGVFARVIDPVGQQYWEQLGDMHNARTNEYILNAGNHMLHTPLIFDNTSGLTGNNVLLSDHAYYSFESVV